MMMKTDTFQVKKQKFHSKFDYINLHITQFKRVTFCIIKSIDKPHKKPQNNNENQVIVETNPVNNIVVEAPMITTIIGHPIIEPVPGIIKSISHFSLCIYQYYLTVVLNLPSFWMFRLYGMPM